MSLIDARSSKAQKKLIRGLLEAPRAFHSGETPAVRGSLRKMLLPGTRAPITGLPRQKNMLGNISMNIHAARASTRTYALAYPFVTEGGMPASAVYMGQDASGGGAFCADPWDWYAKGFITGASIVLIGTVGTGKSTCAKTLASRLVLTGRKCAVASDPKGEWVRVAEFLGGTVIAVGPGRSNARMNPLDSGQRPSMSTHKTPLSDSEWEGMKRGRRSSVLTAIATIMLGGRPILPAEHTALSRALDASTKRLETPTITSIIYDLRHPSEEVQSELGDHHSDMVHALGRMCEGDLAGMFDEESTVEFDPFTPMMVIDTSALQGASPDARKIANLCTSAWIEAAITNPDLGRWLVVYEEGWDTMSDPALLARMVTQWKIAREYGLVNMLIMHKIADLDMAGDEGSATRAMAKSLLADAEIRIVYRQEFGSLPETVRALGLSEPEAEQVKELPRGVGLWKVGGRAFVVRNLMTKAEENVFNTSSRMDAA